MVRTLPSIPRRPEMVICSFFDNFVEDNRILHLEELRLINCDCSVNVSPA